MQLKKIVEKNLVFIFLFVLVYRCTKDEIFIIFLFKYFQPKHKKKWINGKNIVKFRLKNICDIFQDFEEHMKYGIFFDDDYDYMQHLRSLNERFFKFKFLNHPDIIFLVNDFFKDVVPDPEIVAALDGNFDFDNPENILEDDFILKACDGELPPKMPTKSISDADFEIRHPDTSSESDDENDVNDEMDFDDFSVEMEADAVDSNEEFNQIEVEASGPKKVDWDCESILTTYTNIYNHPTIIKDPCRKRKIKPSNDIEVNINMVDIDSQSLASTRTVSTMRPPGETSEERKLRKNAIKELRRERRAEKKSNKLAYKKERLKLFQSGTQVKMRRLV
ncbi:unnamed protein product [Dracunculus medinensis]|uniref:Protein LTV1 homolog n=1 Tax=Dracunculus medinensis TaxID=318479 RepID=A0A3P7TAD1_DRAME|nr:unnamed protein product [Dracunculus medinensis]